MRTVEREVWHEIELYETDHYEPAPKPLSREDLTDRLLARPVAGQDNGLVRQPFGDSEHLI